MRCRLSAVFIALALSAAFIQTGLAEDFVGVRFRNLQEGLTEGRASGKPLLVFFTADWCPPCRELEFGIFRASVFVKRIETDFVPVKVVDRRREDGRNAPDVHALMERSSVSGFPTLLVLHADGDAAVRHLGYSSRGDAIAFLREALQRLQAAEKRAHLQSKH